MPWKRRHVLTATIGAATVSLTGCLSDGDGASDSTDSQPDEWTAFDVTQDVEYTFEEGGPISYETDQPAEITTVEVVRKGEDLEIRGTIQVNELPIVLSPFNIRAEFFDENGESYSGGNTIISRSETGEESFTLPLSSTRLDRYTSLVLHVEGPDPDEYSQ